MDANDIRHARNQYNGLRSDAAAEVRQLLHSIHDGSGALLDRLTRYGHLDEHDLEALAGLVSTTVRAGRAGVRLDLLDRVNHLVPTEEDADDAEDEQ